MPDWDARGTARRWVWLEQRRRGQKGKGKPNIVMDRSRRVIVRIWVFGLTN